MSLGGILSGVGAIASGFGLGKSEPDKGPDIHVQYKENRFHEMELFNQKMALAKHHGIHPLAVLGIPTSNFSPVVSSGGMSAGTDWASIGAGASQLAGAFVKPPDDKTSSVDPLAERAAEANVRLLEAQAKRAEWEALGAEWRVADYAAPRLLTGQPGNPPGARVSNDVVEMQRLAAEQAGLSPHAISGGAAPITLEQSVLPPHPRKLGYGAATDQAFVTTMDSTGRPGTVLNQNAIQAEFEQGATMTLLTRLFGVDRAIEIMAALEQKGAIGAAALGAGYAAKKAWEIFRKRHPAGRAVDAGIRIYRDARGRFTSKKGGK